MPILFEPKCVFVHIPKNAGTSIYESLGMHYGGGYRTCLQLRDEGYTTWEGLYAADKVMTVPIEDWDSYFKFTVVRNPFDRVVSNYRYILRKDSYWHAYDGSEEPVHTGGVLTVAHRTMKNY